MSAMEGAPLAFELRGLRQGFRGGLLLRRRSVLHGIDLALPRGATLGLVGPNGSGKSSLLRCIAGLDRPLAGELRVLGGNPAQARVRRRIGYLPEESPFPGELSARAALALLGSLQGMEGRRVRARSAELLARVGLERHAHRPLRTFSRGMKRRFGLAQAWLHEPELLLLDEPSAGLDAQGFGALAELLAEARQRGASVVLCSHLAPDIERGLDALAVLLEGRLVAAGSPAELLALPGRWKLELGGIDAARLAELRAWIEAQGAAVLDCAPSLRPLLELYRGAEAGR